MAEMLSIEKRAISKTGLPMEVVSCGVPFLFVPVRRIQDVRSIRFRRDVWERALQDSEPQMSLSLRRRQNSRVRRFAA
jgi:trans-2,3-dihydro-3-hydroxyanthranilate isomerase